MKRRNHFPLLLLLPFLSLTALLLAGVGNVLLQSLGYIPAFGLRHLTPDYFLAIFRRPDFLQALWVSLRIALLSAVWAAVLGTVLCWALISCSRGSGTMRHLLRLPILVPHAVVAVFVLQLLSQTGLAARICHALGLIESSGAFPQLIYTPNYTGAILAYLWKEIPFVAYYTLALMASVSASLGEAAENLGASPLRSFLTVTLPLSLPAVLKAFLIIFVFAFGGYELPFLLGVTVPKALPVQAYLAYTSPDLLQRPYAMAMNMVILLFSLGMAVLYWIVMRALLRRTGGAV